MPCRLRIKIYEARDLPIMDSKSNLTDAYVEVRDLISWIMLLSAFCRSVFFILALRMGYVLLN
jgi:hypothetical protein